MKSKRLKRGKNVSSESAAELSLCVKEHLFDTVRDLFLETAKLPEEYAEISEEITANGYLILRTGHNLNEYYEAVSGKTVFDNRRTEMGVIVREIYEITKPLIESKELAFICKIPEENVFVNIDREKFSYAILDILLNAAENTPAGGRIRISFQRTKKYAKLIIGDNGFGMDKDTLSHCTEPFYSASFDGRKKMGLGLTLAHNFVSQSGGRINIKSEKGAGTTVEMLLPIVTGSDPELSASATVPDILGGKLSPVYIVLSGIKK